MAKKIEHDKYAVYIIFLVAIVGVVAIGAIISDVQSSSLVGEGWKKLQRQRMAGDNDRSASQGGTSAGESSDGSSSDGSTDSSGVAGSGAGEQGAAGESKAAQEEPLVPCSDTDAGLEYNVQGTVTGEGVSQPYSMTDYCAGGELWEFYCNQDGFATYEAAVDCEQVMGADYKCFHGECVQSDSVLFKLHYGDAMTGYLDENHMPTVLAEGTFVDVNNNQYDYNQRIEFMFDETNIFMFVQDDTQFPTADSALYVGDSTYHSYYYILSFDSYAAYDIADPASSIVGSEIEIMGDEYEITDLDHSNGTITSITLNNALEIINNAEVEISGQPVEGSAGFIDATQGTWDGFGFNWLPGPNVFGDLYLSPGSVMVLPPLNTLSYNFGGINYNGPIEVIEFITGSTSGYIRFYSSDGTEVQIPLAATSGDTAVYYGADAPEIGNPNEDDLLYLESEACVGSNQVIWDCEGAMFLVLDGTDAHLMEIGNFDVNNNELDLIDLTYGKDYTNLAYIDGSSTTFNFAEFNNPFELIIHESLGVQGEIEFVNIGSSDGAEIITETGAVLTIINQDTSSQVFEGLYFDEHDDGAPITSYLSGFEITAAYDDLGDNTIEFRHSIVTDGYGWEDESDVNDDFIHFMTWKGTKITYDVLELQSVMIEHPENAVTAEVYVQEYP
jgi:hypothetical protein